MSKQFTTDERQIKFLEPHVGGNLNDTNTQFLSQKNIVEENNDLYIDLLNNTNDILRNKNQSVDHYKSSEYMLEQKKEYYTKDARINNFPTIINDNVNVSNPIIYPKDYDPYFEYLFKKGIKSINTQVIQKKLYLNIDSLNRIKLDVMNVEQYFKLVNNPLIFKNESKILQIKFTNANEYFNIDDKISLQGFNFYLINYKKVNFYFNNESNQVIIDIIPNFVNEIPYYNVLIEISGVTNDGSDFFKNIPLNVINDIHTIKLVTTSSSETKFLFTIPMNFYTDNINYNVLTSNCSIKYYFIGNYPINYINSGLPSTLYNLNPYFIVDSVDSDYLYVNLTNEISLLNSISIQLSGNWINNNTFETGGSSIQIGKIKNIMKTAKNISITLLNILLYLLFTE
jgi:hypothetical protein